MILQGCLFYLWVFLRLIGLLIWKRPMIYPLISPRYWITLVALLASVVISAPHTHSSSISNWLFKRASTSLCYSKTATIVPTKKNKWPTRVKEKVCFLCASAAVCESVNHDSGSCHPFVADIQLGSRCDYASAWLDLVGHLPASLQASSTEISECVCGKARDEDFPFRQV